MSQTMITLREAADEIGCSRRFLEIEVNRGRLRVLRLSNRLVRVLRGDFDAYLTLCASAPDKPEFNYESARKDANEILRDPEVRNYIFRRDKHRCKRCGAKEKLTIDHIIPVKLRGPSSHDNLETLCSSCNRKKWDRPPLLVVRPWDETPAHRA